MTECMHDPAFIFDGICSICHRQRRKLIAFMREHDAELTATEIIYMKQRCAETSRAEDYDEREGRVC